MSYCNWEDFDKQATAGYQPFNLLVAGVKLLIDGLSYKAAIKPWPSMCGGRVVTIRPSPLSEYERSNLGPQVVDSEDILKAHYNLAKNILPCHDAGLVFVDALVPRRLLADFIQYIEGYVALLNAEEGYRASVALPSTMAGTFRQSDLTDHVYVYAIISVANEASHDGEDSEGSWTCEECDGEVDEEGHCDECDWYTPRPDTGAAEEDGWMTGEPDVDYEDAYGHEAAVEAFAYRRNHEEVLTWNWGQCWETPSSTGSSRPSAFVHAGLVSRAAKTSEELDVMMLIRKYLVQVLYNRGPVLISSNISDPMYATPYLMAALIRQRNDLLANGIELVRVKEHFATNPNERQHYIDGMALVPINTSRINELMTSGGHVL